MPFPGGLWALGEVSAAGDGPRACPGGLRLATRSSPLTGGASYLCPPCCDFTETLTDALELRFEVSVTLTVTV